MLSLGWLGAQTPLQLPPGGLMQLQVQQPTVDVSAATTARAVFDPPTVRAGQKAFYRVTLDATESAVEWPAELPAPSGLDMGQRASGEIAEMQAAHFRPLSSFVYEVRAAAPGQFTITNFSVEVSGTRIEVPAATLEVVAVGAAAGKPRQLGLEISQTNLFLGEPFQARVILPAGPNNEVEALREIELPGSGLMIDKFALRQAIEPVNVDGRLKMAFTAELVVTPIATGRLKLSAQGFTAGREFVAPISFRGQVRLPPGAPDYTLLVSDPVEIQVRPLPAEGELPGFTGSIGHFFMDPPVLATSRLQVGEPVELRLAFHGEGDLSRLVPPDAPLSRDWQIIADPPPATSFTLIPLSDEPRSTPAIPFSYFDPETGRYVDLTVPELPVTIVGQALPMELPAASRPEMAAVPSKLSALAPTSGRRERSFEPLQLSGWFAALQLAPLAGFLALWQWDRRRRYREAHPDIVRRARARRALRREKRQLHAAAAAGDAAGFIRHAARAMTIAVAPHFPANPEALVCGDVLAQLSQAGKNGEVAESVKRVFAAADAGFALAPTSPPELASLQSGVEQALQTLEERL